MAGRFWLSITAVAVAALTGVAGQVLTAFLLFTHVLCTALRPILTRKTAQDEQLNHDKLSTVTGKGQCCSIICCAAINKTLSSSYKTTCGAARCGASGRTYPGRTAQVPERCLCRTAYNRTTLFITVKHLPLQLALPTTHNPLNAAHIAFKTTHATSGRFVTHRLAGRAVRSI